MPYHQQYCDVHDYIEQIIRANTRIYIDKSWLGNFNGLFANSSIAKDDIICIYTGRVYSTVESMRIPVEDRDYLMRIGEQCYVDAKPCQHIIARYINDCRQALAYNARFEKVVDIKVAYVIATKEILPNEEIFADYGKWYWLQKNPIAMSLLELGRRKMSLTRRESLKQRVDIDCA